MIVAIEGVDGSGKTTQAKMLVERLNREGYKAVYVQPAFILLKNSPFSPRKSRINQMNRAKRSKISSIIRPFIGVLGYLYALITCIFLAFYLSRNKIVVCDRYFYQFFFDLFGNLSEVVIKVFPKPNFTFFLEGDLGLFHSRMGSSDIVVSKDYYQDVLSLYRKISQDYDCIQVDANLKKEEINEKIFNYLLVVTRKLK